MHGKYYVTCLTATHYCNMPQTPQGFSRANLYTTRSHVCSTPRTEVLREINNTGNVISARIELFRVLYKLVIGNPMLNLFYACHQCFTKGIDPTFVVALVYSRTHCCRFTTLARFISYSHVQKSILLGKFLQIKTCLIRNDPNSK